MTSDDVRVAIYKTAGKNLYTANMDSIPPTSDSFLESELAQDGDYQDAGEISHLRRLYKQVLYFFIEENKIYDKMDAAISEVITSFKYSEGHRFKEVNFKHADMCCGYIFRYAAHGAALTRCRILEGLDHCNELKSILMKKEVKLVSLGCGPGNDAIGFCSAMRRANFPGTLKILLVDAIENWSDYTLKAKQLLCNGDFGETSEFFQRNQVRLFKFYRCTLPEQLTFNLSEFDVVLICKLMSIMEIEKHDRFIQVIISFTVNAY